MDNQNFQENIDHALAETGYHFLDQRARKFRRVRKQRGRGSSAFPQSQISESGNYMIVDQQELSNEH